MTKWNPLAGGRICLQMIGIGICALVYVAAVGAETSERVDIARNKPATSSSIENDEHDAAKANDGDPQTSWRADDEPEGGPEWWQVDLEKPFDLAGCQIHWPYDGMSYCYKVEGSANRKTWSILSDQTQTKATPQVQDLKFKDTREIRYVRITITGFTEGCWASLSEVKIFASTTGAGK